MTSPQVATRGKAPRLSMLAGGLILIVALLLSAAPGVAIGQTSAALGRLTTDARIWSNVDAMPSAKYTVVGSGTEPQRFASRLQAATPLAVGTPVPCAGGENLLENGGFEAGTEGWYVNESVEAVNTSTHEGTMAVRLEAGVGDAYTDHGVSPPEPGATYTLSAWGKLSTGGEIGEIGVQFYDSDGERLMNDEPPSLTFSGTAYEQRQLTFSLPDQVARIYVFISKVEGAADFYADSLSLTNCGVEAPAEMLAAATPVATPGLEILATPAEEEPDTAPTAEPVAATPEEQIGATPVASQISKATATPSESAADRSGCDPAYPEDRTCIPPGPPFEQGCAITMERNFVVLPPDPQALDHDLDGIGCEPVSQ